MKKKQIKGVLKLDKITVARLSNSNRIIGGNTVVFVETSLKTDVLTNNKECITKYDITCATVTGVGATSLGDRPTERHTACNCAQD